MVHNARPDIIKQFSLFAPDQRAHFEPVPSPTRLPHQPLAFPVSADGIRIEESMINLGGETRCSSASAKIQFRMGANLNMIKYVN